MQNALTKYAAPMRNKKLLKPDDAEQSKRFIETAEEVEAEDEQALERAFKKIISPTERPSKQS